MSNSCGRRSSFKDPQVQEGIRNVIPQEVFRGSYSDFNLSNISRLSANSLRGSLTQPKRGSNAVSGIPPSQYKRLAGANTSEKQDVSYMGSARARPTSVTAGPSSGNRTGIPRVASLPRKSAAAPARNLPHQKLQNPALVRAASQSSGLNSTRRRSRSHDSLSQTQSVLCTPAFTPRARSKSPRAMSTSRRRGVHNEVGDAGKSITIPKDKKILGEMARYVYDFLNRHDCQAKPADWKDLVNHKISYNQFGGMIKFLASHFVGNEYFSKTDKPDDDAEKIIELFKILKYPGTLSKSHLKTPTVQHAWPGCFTFLTWLCVRTEALLTPPTERTNIDEIVNADYAEFAFDSYLSLFPLHFTNGLEPDHIEQEMENFKMRVREAQATELTKTKEELLVEKAERQTELEHLSNEVDPAMEIKKRLAVETEVMESIDLKIREAENSCKKYSNVNHLKLQNERIQMDIDAKASELARIKQQVQSQPLNKQEASLMLNETTGLKNQLDSIRHVNTNLRKETEVRSKKLEDCQKKFYDLCKEFGVVENYNENLRFLRMDEYSIPPNPFSPAELEEWMKDASKTLQRAQARVSDLVREVSHSSGQKEQENQKFLAEMNQLKKQVDEVNAKIVSVQKYKDFISSEYEKKQIEAQNQLDELNTKLRLQEEEYDQARKEKESAAARLQQWNASVVDYKNKHDEMKEQLEAKMTEFWLYVRTLKKKVHDLITSAAQQQQACYLTHFGVDIFEDLDSGPQVATTCPPVVPNSELPPSATPLSASALQNQNPDSE